jgi:hypothetical protein
MVLFQTHPPAVTSHIALLRLRLAMGRLLVIFMHRSVITLEVDASVYLSCAQVLCCGRRFTDNPWPREFGQVLRQQAV